MKTWMFWVLLLVFVFVVVPLIYFAIVAKSVVKVKKSDSGTSNVSQLTLEPSDSNFK